MATVLTGRDLTITIDAQDYAPQTAEFRLQQEEDRQSWELISGRVDKVVDVTGQLELTLLADWGDDAAGTSLCGALWDAVTNNPDTGLAVTLGSDGDTWAGEVYPSHGDGPGGAGKDGQQVSFVLPITPTGKFVRTAAIA